MDDDDDMLHQSKILKAAAPGFSAGLRVSVYIGIRRGLYTINGRFSTLAAAIGKLQQ
jgi:hypothetical protein